MRRNANSGCSIVTKRRVVPIFFELGVVKIFTQKSWSQDTSWLFLCLKIVLDRNNFIYKYNRLSDARLMINIAKEPIIGLYHHFQTAITFANISLKQSYKIPVKKDLMRIILSTTYEHLKLHIILYIFHVVIIFFIYQTSNSVPNRFKFLPSKFRQYF